MSSTTGRRRGVSGRSGPIASRHNHPSARARPAAAGRSGLYLALAFLIVVFNLLGLVMVMSA